MLGITLWEKDKNPNTFVSVTENTESFEKSVLHVGAVHDLKPSPDIVINRNQAYDLFMWLGHWLFTEHEDEIQSGEKIWGEDQNV